VPAGKVCPDLSAVCAGMGKISKTPLLEPAGAPVSVRAEAACVVETLQVWTAYEMSLPGLIGPAGPVRVVTIAVS
jgi:hypothetical protein